MIHIEKIPDSIDAKNLLIKLTGRYYTDEKVSRLVIKNSLRNISSEFFSRDKIKIIDPFGGDGRLIYYFIEEWNGFNYPNVKWDIQIWDIYKNGIKKAQQELRKFNNKEIEISCTTRITDSFKYSRNFVNKFDIVITNPPWEILKPDSRDLKIFSELEKEDYIQSLKRYDNKLSSIFPDSQPSKKYAGWGTNLSRVGLDASFLITKEDGYCIIFLPTSFFADEQSKQIRRKIFEKSEIINITFFPAEARLFGKADVESSALTFLKTVRKNKSFCINKYDKELSLDSSEQIEYKKVLINANDYSIPITAGLDGIKILNKIRSNFPQWKTIEKQYVQGLWSGREIDETRINDYLSDNKNEGYKFIKGRMIERFRIKEQPSKSYIKELAKQPKSIKHEKIVWRDISRYSQKRRIIAAIVPKNVVAGNSLGVCYFTDGDSIALKILLGIMNSFCFEFQLRNYLATGHVSLSAIRKVCIPNRNSFPKFLKLSKLVDAISLGDEYKNYELEAYVAKFVYSLSLNEFIIIMNSFKKVNMEEKNELISCFKKLKIDQSKKQNYKANGKILIPNHLTSNLSDMDMLVVKSVPPGGNWKNIPLNIPSKRISQIRESFRAGKGSRSTYYGRLLPDKPSYTINTYFNRPGNGCHIHYKQDRVLSQREAARLQSFPDNFIFLGPQNSVNNQIGNAVPPLLAFQIANQINNTIKQPGVFIDLFSGAGGLGLGFKWAGWIPSVANDIDSQFLETYKENIHNLVVPGSITDKNVFNKILEIAMEFKKNNTDKQIWVLGGPPCQGFSTAGKKRTMDDKRNHLFTFYSKFLEQIRPDGFLFENVSGLLNMDNGSVYTKVKNEFNKMMPRVQGYILNSEEYAIPQRRKRVFLIGQKNIEESRIEMPSRLTSIKMDGNLFEDLNKCISVEEAIGDLPELIPGQNGSTLEYKSNPKSPFQALMRGDITPLKYLTTYN